MIVVALILPAQILTILLSSLLSFNLSYSDFFLCCPTSTDHHQFSLPNGPPHWYCPRILWNLWTWSQSSLSLFDILNTLSFFCFLPANYISPGLHLLLCKSLFCLVFLIIAVYCLIGSIQLRNIVSSYYHLLYCSYLLSFSLFFLVQHSDKRICSAKILSGKYSGSRKVSVYLPLWTPCSHLQMKSCL